MKENYRDENLSKYIDKNVVVMMVVLLLLSTSILSFKMINHYPCDDVEILVDLDREVRVGEIVKFNTSVDVIDRELQWSIQGSNFTMSNVNNLLHSFDKPGTYNISLNINGTCEKYQEIVVLEKEKIISLSKIPHFELPDSITVGEELMVVDTNSTINGKKWEWRFGETYKVNSESRTAKYAYKTSGLKTISLVVNGDVDHLAKKMIQVLPSPDKPTFNDEENSDDLGSLVPSCTGPPFIDHKDERELRRAPSISEKDFQLKLVQITKSETTEREFLKYFCGDISRDILANGKKMSFQKFCNDHLKGKKIKIKSLELFKGEQYGCVKTINIKYKNHL